MRCIQKRAEAGNAFCTVPRVGLVDAGLVQKVELAVETVREEVDVAQADKKRDAVDGAAPTQYVLVSLLLLY